ncbi:hypothetical protein GOV14_03950 [Candidatus Pacearchaeota archaeon]|nr:hypothetical protein [Candidatus Pacearchaeota archaeon]
MSSRTKNKYSKTISFKDHKFGLYDLDTFVKDWGSEPRRGVAENRCRIVKKKDEKVLEITIPKGTTSKGGSFWRLNLPKGLTDVTFEYDIMFGNNFNFVRGGKLPGLAGGTAPGGGSKDKNGFSARLMWRAAVSYDELCHLVKDPKFMDKKDVHKPYLVQYTYFPDKQTRKWGEDFVYSIKNKKIFLIHNKWYNIMMRIKLAKDPSKKDSLLAWVNGERVLYKRLNLRKNKQYEVGQVMFSLFFGGQDETWATKKKEKVYFRKFLINGS